MWRSVVGYEGLYEVSDSGIVRNTAGLELKPRLTEMYPRWTVRLTKDGKRSTIFVHKLVAEAFIGPRPPGADICHGDGDRDNNSAANLRYDSHSENMRDAVRHGTHSMARRMACPRGHSIRDERNVRRRRSHPNKVECLSCSRAWAAGSYRRRQGEDVTEQDLARDADLRYSALVAPGNTCRALSA